MPWRSTAQLWVLLAWWATLARGFCPYHPSGASTASPSPAPGPATALLEINVTVSGAQYTIPASGLGLARRRTGQQLAAGYTVAWGDGSAPGYCQHDGAPCNHTYANPGTYSLELSGPVLGWSMLFATTTVCRDYFAGAWNDGFANTCLMYAGEAKYEVFSSWSSLLGGNGMCNWYVGAQNQGTLGLDAPQVCCFCGGGEQQPGEEPGAALTAIRRWGQIELHPTAGRHLQNLASLTYVAPLPPAPGLTSLYRSFSGLDSLAGALDVSALDTSQVEDLGYVFAESFLAEPQGLAQWQVGAVRDLSFAFAQTGGRFVGVEGWTTSALVNATGAFSHAVGFDRDLNGWHVSGLLDYRLMFAGATNFSHGLPSWWQSLPGAFSESDCTNALRGTRLQRTAGLASACGSAHDDLILRYQTTSDCGGSYRPALQFLDPGVAGVNGQTAGSHSFSVDFGLGGGFVSCQQAAGTSTCASPVSSAPYLPRQLRLRGVLDGLQGFTHKCVRILEVSSWGQVSMTSRFSSWYASSPSDPRYNWLFNAGAIDNWSYQTQCTYLAPIQGTRAFAHLDDFRSLLYNYRALTGDIGHWDIPLSGNLFALLYSAWAFNQPLFWNTTGVTNMDSVFANTRVFNADLSALDVSNVQSFKRTFEAARDFNQPLAHWNTRHATSLYRMFAETKKFNQDISSWDVSQVQYFDSMFHDAQEFNQPLAGWRIAAPSSSMISMFKNTRKFNQPLGAWNMSTVYDIGYQFANAKAFNQDLSGWDVRSLHRGDNMWASNRHIFDGACAFNQDLSAWDVPAFVLEVCQDFVQSGWFTFAQLPYVACQQAYGAGSFTTTNQQDRQTYCASLP